MLFELDHGVLDRFLISPVSRAALIAGHLGHQVITVMVQAMVVLVLAVAVGAHLPGGFPGVLVMLVAATLIVLSIGSLSMAFALVIRRPQSLTATIQFILLPLVFMSSAFMVQRLAAGWITSVARFNPIDWAVQAGRTALAANADWGLVFSRLGWLCVLAVVCAAVTVQSFRAYQRSL